MKKIPQQSNTELLKHRTCQTVRGYRTLSTGALQFRFNKLFLKQKTHRRTNVNRNEQYLQVCSSSSGDGKDLDLSAFEKKMSQMTKDEQLSLCF